MNAIEPAKLASRRMTLIKKTDGYGILSTYNPKIDVGFHPLQLVQNDSVQKCPAWMITETERPVHHGRSCQFTGEFLRELDAMLNLCQLHANEALKDVKWKAGVFHDLLQRLLKCLLCRN